MKTIQQLRLIALMAIIPLFALTAQDKTKMYWIHVDHVKPSMVGEYEAVTKELVKHCTDHNFKGGDWITLSSIDNDYSFIAPIDNYSELGNNTFAELYEKVGDEKMNALWTKMNQCYTDHEDYILHLDPELSYQPGGINQAPAGMNYRNNRMFYVSPENYSKANELAGKFKELYTKKESKLHYRVYKSGFGADGTYFMVAVAASNPASYESMTYENNKLLGAEGQALFGELMSLIDKTETIQGWIRPELGYTAKK